MKDLKYIAAFSLPLVAFIGLYFKGMYSFLTPVYAFGIIPLLEIILPVQTRNLTKDEVDSKLKKTVFDWLLYLNLPIVFLLVYFSLF